MHITNRSGGIILDSWESLTLISLAVFIAAIVIGWTMARDELSSFVLVAIVLVVILVSLAIIYNPSLRVG